MNQFELFASKPLPVVRPPIFLPNCYRSPADPRRDTLAFWDAAYEAAFMDAPEVLPCGSHWNADFVERNGDRQPFIHATRGYRGERSGL